MSLPVRSVGPLRVSALGLGCMGMSFVLRRHRRRRVARHAGPRARPRRHLPRHRRHVRRRRQRGARRPGARRPARRGRAGDQVRHPAPATTATPVGVDGRPGTSERRARRRCAGSASTRSTCTTMHRRDPNVPIEDTVGAMAELVAAGKVRAPRPLRGVADDRCGEPHAVHPIAAAAVEWSLFSRDLEAEIVPTVPRARHRPRAVLSPLGRGFLTGALTAGRRPRRRRLPPHAAALHGRRTFDANLRAGGRGSGRSPTSTDATPGQVALAWLLAQGDDVVPIPGTKRVALPGGERRRARGDAVGGRHDAARRPAPGGRPLPGHDLGRAQHTHARPVGLSASRGRGPRGGRRPAGRSAARPGPRPPAGAPASSGASCQSCASTGSRAAGAPASSAAPSSASSSRWRACIARRRGSLIT